LEIKKISSRKLDVLLVADEVFLPSTGTALNAILANDKTSIIERRTTPIFERVFIFINHTFLLIVKFLTCRFFCGLRHYFTIS